jgi:hypothetical protein
VRTWTRASQKETICGGPCTHPMRKGDPLLEIRIAGINGGKDILLKRCATCANEPVPEDLPPLAEPEPIVPMAHIRTGVNALPFDYKSAQAGREREVGEEG